MSLQDDSISGRSHRIWYSGTAGVLGGILALAYVLWPPSSFIAWVLLAVYASGLGLATWTLLTGLKAGSVEVAVLSGLSLFMLPLLTRLDFVESMLTWVGRTADRPFGLTWIRLGESSVSTLALIGMATSVVTSLAAAVVAKRLDGTAGGPTLMPKPLPVSLLAGLAGFALVVWDLGVLAIPVGIATGVGAAALAVGTRARRRWLVASGWISFGSIPVLHAIAIMLPIGGGWAPTILFDLMGAGLAVAATVVCVMGLWMLRGARERNPK